MAGRKKYNVTLRTLSRATESAHSKKGYIQNCKCRCQILLDSRTMPMGKLSHMNRLQNRLCLYSNSTHKYRQAICKKKT